MSTTITGQKEKLRAMSKTKQKNATHKTGFCCKRVKQNKQKNPLYRFISNVISLPLQIHRVDIGAVLVPVTLMIHSVFLFPSLSTFFFFF